ncbi:MAG: hypothetical protein KIT00_02815 [Rhodospirillales bacterium]|nr:hypothetical protein [Rhodospirillales bacterium]
MFAAVGAISALLLSASILLAGNGLQGTLISVRASLEAFPTAQIGLLVTGYFAGFIAGSLLAPGIIQRAGHIRAFASFAAIAAASSLVHAMIVRPEAWIALRVVIGFAFAGFIYGHRKLAQRGAPRGRPEGGSLLDLPDRDLTANTGSVNC